MFKFKKKNAKNERSDVSSCEDRKSNWAWENSSFINPNLFEEEEESSGRERRFVNADFSATLDSLRDTELPTMHLTNSVTLEFNNKDHFCNTYAKIETIFNISIS